jgi:hypothetical protein
MRRLWSTDELDERWSLSPGDLALLVGHSDAGKLGLACQLAFWRVYGCFPEEEADLAPAVIAHLAAQVGVPVEAIESYAFSSRSARRHRKAVLDHLAVRDFDGAAEAAFRTSSAGALAGRPRRGGQCLVRAGADVASRRLSA